MLKESWNKRILILFFSQLFILLILTVFFYLFENNEKISLSFFLGGVVYCGPSLFANFMMGREKRNSAQKIIKKAYLSSLYKTIISIILFIYIYKKIAIVLCFFMLGFLVVYFVQYFVQYVVVYFLN